VQSREGDPREELNPDDPATMTSGVLSLTRERMMRYEQPYPTSSDSGTRRYRTGTFAFSSSNQFVIKLICVTDGGRGTALLYQ